MTDRDRSEDGQQRAEGADRGREGFGDDGGTRVGRPSPATGADEQTGHTGPSSQPVKEGLEGAIFEGDEDARDRGAVRKPGPGGASSRERPDASGSLGAGAEAAEGTHNAMRERSPAEQSGVDAAADQLGDTADATDDDAGRRGSEPLTGRTNEHVSGYGGAGGTPKTSSDQRE